MKKEEALIAIMQHLELCNEKSENWIAAITNNVDQFLNEHDINKIHGLWISRELSSYQDAKDLKYELTKKFHMNNEENDEQGTSIIVYKNKSK